MRSRPIAVLVCAAFGLLAAARLAGQAQPTPSTQQEQGRGGRGRQAGPGGGGGRQGTFPQFRRPAADAAVIARGKGLFEANCAACHGVDLRGGQQGGPNLLRSQLVLSDKQGEAISQVIQSGRPNPTPPAPPMPAFPQLQPDAVQAIAEYIHSVLAQAGGQGRPPGAGQEVPPEKILIGNAAAGQAYFAANCSNCHSVTGDLKGLATRAADARDLQNRWVSGGAGGGRGGRGGEMESSSPRRAVVVTVTPSGGRKIEGRLVRMDDFVVTLVQADGTRRTIRRNGDDPKVDVHDPMDAHHKFATSLTDKDMHDVTAYLWSLR